MAEAMFIGVRCMCMVVCLIFVETSSSRKLALEQRRLCMIILALRMLLALDWIVIVTATVVMIRIL